MDFDEFFRATWPRLFRTAYAVAGDAASAEEALQGAYVKAYASWHRVSRAEHPEAYVRRIVVNEILGTRRRGWWQRERPHESPEPPGQVASPDVAVVERDAVWLSVQALAPRQRAVIVLRYYEDLSELQIAEILGCSTGTVKSQASAALTNLRRNAAYLSIGERS
jgi:RNA polymerase sigma-70 factor (sigma-E family)